MMSLAIVTPRYFTDLNWISVAVDGGGGQFWILSDFLLFQKYRNNKTKKLTDL